MKLPHQFHKDPSARAAARPGRRPWWQLSGGLAVAAMSATGCVVATPADHNFPARVLIENDATHTGYLGIGGLLEAPTEYNDTQQVTLENGTEIGLRCIDEKANNRYEGYVVNGKWQGSDNVLLDTPVGQEVHNFTLLSGGYDAVKSC